MQILKEKTTNLTHQAGAKWEASKPRRQKAQDELKSAAERVVDFGKEVQKGFKAGVAEIQNSNKRKGVTLEK